MLGAIFDCDGLLADTETPDYDAWREIYEEQGLHLPVELWAQTIGTAKGQSQNDWHTPLAERRRAGLRPRTPSRPAGMRLYQARYRQADADARCSGPAGRAWTKPKFPAPSRPIPTATG